MVHLVYCDDKEKVLEKILDSSKTMIIRAAAGIKIPHSRVFVDEKLYFMKKSTAKISATATAKSNLLTLTVRAIWMIGLLLKNRRCSYWYKHSI